MVIIGGMGTLWGPLIGAAVMVVLPELLRDVGALRFVIVGIIFVVLMIFRPFGILGARRPERSLQRTIGAEAAPADDLGSPARVSEARESPP